MWQYIYMNNEVTNILPTKALDLFLAGVPAADILDTFTPLPDSIGRTMDGNGIGGKSKHIAPGGRKVATTAKHIRKAIALAEDAHQGITDETAGTL